jgi:hypothetical protein
MRARVAENRKIAGLVAPERYIVKPTIANAAISSAGLRTVRWLLPSTALRDQGSVADRFDYAVVVTVHQAIRQAEAKLQAAGKQAEKAGAAQVDQDVLELIRTFNSIGPARLKELYRSRQ